MKSKLFLSIALALIAAALLSACGGSDSSSSSGSTEAATTEEPAGGEEATGGEEEAGGGDAALAAAKKSAAESVAIPTEIEANQFGPVTPQKGALLYFIGCDQSIPGCVAQVHGFEEGAKAAG